MGLRHSASAHGLEGSIHGAQFPAVFSPAALDLPLVWFDLTWPKGATFVLRQRLISER